MENLNQLYTEPKSNKCEGGEHWRTSREARALLKDDGERSEAFDRPVERFSRHSTHGRRQSRV